MDLIIIFFAQYFLFLLPLAAFVWWVRCAPNKKRVVAFAIASGILALVLAKISGQFIHNPRPFTEGLVPLFGHSADNGFPSDHTLLAAAVAFVVLAYDKRWGFALLLGAVVVGTARVLAHVHHAVDIIGAILIAAIATLIVWVMMNKWAKKHSVVSSDNK